MSENLKVWNALKTPPQAALKKIQAGRLKGMNDINPQWRIMAMTQQFGVCGVGWKYTIDRQWIESVANNEVLAFVNISLYIRNGENWSDAIPANGGSKITAKESGGLYNSDEAFKMAFTDALGVAMKMLGMAADVYMGVFDGKNGEAQNVKVSQPEKPVEKVANEQISDSEWQSFSELVQNATAMGINLPQYDRSKMTASTLNGAKQYITKQIQKKEGK